MSPGVVFGLAVGCVLLLAWASGSHVLQKLALLLLMAWAGTNLAVAFLGFERAPLVIPSIDAVIAVLVATTGYHAKSKAALFVFRLYAVVGLIHIGAYVLHMLVTNTYYAALNSVFLVQLLIVGATSAWVAVHHRFDLGGERFRHHPAGG